MRFSSRFQQTASGVCLHDVAHKIAYIAFGKVAHAHATKLLLVSVVQLYRSERISAVVQPYGCTVLTPPSLTSSHADNSIS